MTHARATIVHVLCLVLCTPLAVPAGAAAEPTAAPSPPPDPGAVRERLERDRAWYRRHLVATYRTEGESSPKWDADALEALQAASDLWARDPERRGEEQECAWQAADRAVRAGCRDALVLYVRARMYDAAARESTAESARMHREAATAMRFAPYGPLLRALAHVHAAETAIEHATSSSGSGSGRGIGEQVDAARALIDEVAADAAAPTPLVRELVEGLLDAGRRLGHDRREDFQPIAKAFEKARGVGDPLPHVLEASFLVAYAWDARGGRSAGEVPESGWEVFRARLEAAEQAVARAQALDRGLPALAPLMLSIELGLGRGRERMEAWFRYGLAADPGSFRLYLDKLHYLEPRWHGSPSAMLAFGREALDTEAWTLKVPFVLVFAHFQLSRDLPDPDAYFADNVFGVCDDVHAVYEPYLERFPDAAYERSGYALMLYQCGDYAAADRAFRALGSDGRIGPFLTRANYEHKRADAAARARARQR